MKRFAVVLVAVALASCGGAGAGDGSSGIRGQALAGPQCPVETQASPCPLVPYEGTVIAADAPGWISLGRSLGRRPYGVVLSAALITRTGI